MALPVTFTFPAAATNAICLAQTISAAGNLVINGSLLDTPPTVNGVFQAIMPGIRRTVTITSTSGANLSGILFTIYGLNSRHIATSQAVTGPTATTVVSTTEFHYVTRVATNAAVNSSVEVGTGSTGHTEWWVADRNTYPGNIGISATVSGPINYTLDGTYTDMLTETAARTTYTVTGMVSQSTAIQGLSLTTPPGALRWTINSSSATGAATFTIIQQSRY